MVIVYVASIAVTDVRTSDTILFRVQDGTYQKMFNVLDLCCGGGGAAKGIHDALSVIDDVVITGVDIVEQPQYPYNFVFADAMTFPTEGYDFIWASPPCLEYTQAGAAHRAYKIGLNPYPDLLQPMIHKLKKQDTPFVIENVMAAPMSYDLMLCGTMFNLYKLLRHRMFKTNFPVVQPKHNKHVGRVGKEYITVAGGGGGGQGGNKLSEWQKAMEIDWLWMGSLAKAVPPAYSRYITQEWLKTL